jgi:MoaA/NifB/PqqE/SkfB family radical SAM enzyme
MSYAEYEIIADKIRPYAKYVFVHCWGEPLLNPAILDICKLTKDFSSVDISTNCQNMTKEMAEELMLLGVDVIVSMDGTTQATYEKYRVGGDIQKVYQAIEWLDRYKRKHQHKNKLDVQFCAFKHNEHEIEQFLELGKKFQAAYFSVKTSYLRSNSSLKPTDDFRYRRPFSETNKVVQFMKHCPDPYKAMTILVDGSVNLCSYDHNGITTFGNIFDKDSTVESIFNNSQITSIREKMYNGTMQEPCTICLQYVKKS